MYFPFSIFFSCQFCINDPSKTFWDDPKMYIDDPGLETLLSLTTDELLLCQDSTINEYNDSEKDKSLQKERHQLDKSNDGKHALQCTYPNCDKSYFKPSHLKVIVKNYFYSKYTYVLWLTFRRCQNKLSISNNNLYIK